MDKKDQDKVIERSEKIEKKYKEMENRQMEVAKELNIPVSVVGKTTRELGYSYGKKVNPNNRTEKQKVQAFSSAENMEYLLKYNQIDDADVSDGSDASNDSDDFNNSKNSENCGDDKK